MLFNSITELLARFIVLFTAITVHEYAHGYVAYKLGDPTAKYSGRLSLNPISHLDMWGAICMVLFGFGWAKPVPINPMYFRDRKKGMALTALAGPLANIVLAFASTIIFALYFVFIYFSARVFWKDLRFVCVLLNQKNLPPSRKGAAAGLTSWVQIYGQWRRSGGAAAPPSGPPF